MLNLGTYQVNLDPYCICMDDLVNIIQPSCWPHAHGSRNKGVRIFQSIYQCESFADFENTE